MTITMEDLKDSVGRLKEDSDRAVRILIDSMTLHELKRVVEHNDDEGIRDMARTRLNQIEQGERNNKDGLLDNLRKTGGV